MNKKRERESSQCNLIIFSDDDDDEMNDNDDELSFYPMRKSGANGSNIKHELSDTFSLQEMTIMGSDDNTENDEDEDSQTLEFLSPKLSPNIFDKFVKWFCCVNKIQI